MLSLPMNEFIQQSLAEIGIQVDFEVVELENLYLHWRSGAKADMNAGKGITAINLGYVTADPFYALTRFVDSRYIAPNGVNWGGYSQSQGRRHDREDPHHASTPRCRTSCWPVCTSRWSTTR